MNPNDHILAKQIAWAHNKGIDLIGSQGEYGRKVYTTNLKDNLFQSLNRQTKIELEAGDGAEINGTERRPAKMQALHSSSALGVNLFDYWRDSPDLSIITSICGLSSRSRKLCGDIHFEQKFSIDNRFRFSPNIDVLILPNTGLYKCFAIECKFTEAYSNRSHGGLDPKYLDNEAIWQGLKATKDLAYEISPNDHRFEVLHAAQLIKHILGLNRVYNPNQYQLLYLRYDALGKAGVLHTNETGEFASIVRSDGIMFHETTYQDVIVRLEQYREQHPEYVRYLTERYL